MGDWLMSRIWITSMQIHRFWSGRGWNYNIVSMTTHLFIHELVLIEYLLCVLHGTKLWSCSDE